jgi:excinuclease ABC subunit C
VHRSFKVPSCKVDLNKKHAAPCLEFHIHRCLGPCVEGLTTDEAYADAARNAKLFLEGKNRELLVQLKTRRDAASEDLRFEEAAALRDLVSTVEEIDEKQKMSSASGDDIDILAFYAEPPLVAANLFHLRNGRIVDRRELFWEDAHEFDPAEFASALLKQIYLEARSIPAIIHVPAEFEDREALEDILSERRGLRVEIHTPQRGQKKAMADLAATNAHHSFDARFRVMRPTSMAISGALQEALGVETPIDRIECFDISHIQGTDKVASMVVWEKGRMKKSDYRKFIIETVVGNDDFASMKEVVTRRYGRLRDEGKPFPGLILIDGGLGQLHAAADALEALGIINQPLASIAKREETIYVLGQESEPILLDRYSPVLHLIQTVRDEAHRFAVTFHRARRSKARLTSELQTLPGRRGPSKDGEPGNIDRADRPGGGGKGAGSASGTRTPAAGLAGHHRFIELELG